MRSFFIAYAFARQSHATIETVNIGLSLATTLLLPPGRLAANITHVGVSHILLTNSSGTYNLSSLDFLAGALLTQKVLPTLDAALQKGVALPLPLVGATVTYNAGFVQIDADLPAAVLFAPRRSRYN